MNCYLCKNNFDTIERCDLNISNVGFETTWIEIKNKNSKNIVCDSIYRHPHNNFTSTLKYVWVVLEKKRKKYLVILISTYYRLILTIFPNTFLIYSVAMACYPIYYNQPE